MMRTRHRPPPPWERYNSSPRHSTGRARRRWPRAYDGGEPVRHRLNRRYHRAFDGDAAEAERRGMLARQVPGLQRLRQSPVRNGLIGLAVAGVSAPIAVNTYQEALRGDPSHERIVTNSDPQLSVDDVAVMRAWQAMDAEANADAALGAGRETVIEEKVAKYKDFGLSREMAESILNAAEDAEIDPDIAFGLVRAESSFRNTATSPVGAVGLTQLMPRTASWMQPGVKNSELRNPDTNLRIGFKYLNYLLDKYDGNEDLALLAYNRGPGTVDKALKRGANPDNGYAAFVKGEANHGHKLFTSR